MGFIRGALKVIIGILLFLSLLIGNVFLVLSFSLDYDNVQPALSSLVQEIVQNETEFLGDLDEEFVLMQFYCQNNTEFVLASEFGTFTFPCEIVNQGIESVVTYGVEEIVEKTYYDDYECGFWDCVGDSTDTFVLISAKAKNYWQSKFYLFLIISLILLGIMFFLVENKMNLLLIFGILLIITALPLTKLGSFASLFGDNEYGIASVFFSKAISVFWIMVLIGAILLILGIVLRIIFYEYHKKKFSKNEVKDIVRKEVAKSKKVVQRVVKNSGSKKK